MAEMDPRWISLAEAARRVIKVEELTLHLPSRFEQQGRDLVETFAENLPARLTLPSIHPSGGEQVDVISNNGEHLVRLSGEEPDITTCWVPGDADQLWLLLNDQVTDFLEAGYPGCAGCGGEGAEGPWNESNQRLRFTT